MNTVKKRSIFAINLIAIRKAKGISQRELSKQTGISHRMIAYYETHSDIPTFEKLKLIASALDVSIAALIDENISDKKFLKLNTRTLKKVKLFEQLSPENQRKVLDYVKALLAQQELEKK